MKKLLSNVFVISSLVLMSAPAFAADTDEAWDRAATGILGISDGMARIGGPLIGLAIAAIGLWAGMTQRVDWSRLWIVFFAAACVMLGPTIGPQLTSLFSGN